MIAGSNRYIMAFISHAKRNWQVRSLKVTGCYIFVLLLLLSTRVADLYLTYIISPTLDSEWNPLISRLHLSRNTFLWIQVGLILFALLAFHRYMRRVRVPIARKGLSFLQYIIQYFYIDENSKASWAEGIYKVQSR